jgi:hypothetical protein
MMNLLARSGSIDPGVVRDRVDRHPRHFVVVARWRVVNMPLHAGIEALGGLSAVIIGLFLLERREESQGVSRIPLGAGFLGMGILDVFHAITPPGEEFVLLRSMASLVGGSCFALVWLPDRWIGRQERWVPGAVAVGHSARVWALAAPHTLPVMVEGDEFKSTAGTLSLLAGGLFLGAAARLSSISISREV